MSNRSLSSWLPLLAMLFATGCGGPFLLFPGGALEGTATAVPTDWSFTDEISTIQIETNPSDPYSVNIWVVALDSSLYLHAGANRAAWVEHLESDPSLRARIDGSIYDLLAARVTEEGEFARFANAYESKYGSRPRNENLSEIYLLRLEGR